MLISKEQDATQVLVQLKLDEGHLLRPFPGVISQLVSAIGDPNASSKALARIIEADAALASRLLRMANSPVYGFSNVIRSIEHATAILGIRPLKNLALSYAGTTMFSGGAKEAVDQREALWIHSLGCATLARLLSNFVASVNPDEAFLAGIFHDVGKLFFHDVVPTEYARIFWSSTGIELVEQENVLFGVTHDKAGAKLSTAWKLPEPIMVAVGFHHQPESATAHSELATVVHLADGLARFYGIGSCADARIDIFEKAKEYLNLDDDALSTVLEQALQQLKETRLAYSK